MQKALVFFSIIQRFSMLEESTTIWVEDLGGVKGGLAWDLVLG